MRGATLKVGGEAEGVFHECLPTGMRMMKETGRRLSVESSGVKCHELDCETTSPVEGGSMVPEGAAVPRGT